MFDKVPGHDIGAGQGMPMVSSSILPSLHVIQMPQKQEKKEPDLRRALSPSRSPVSPCGFDRFKRMARSEKSDDHGRSVESITRYLYSLDSPSKK